MQDQSHARHRRGQGDERAKGFRTFGIRLARVKGCDLRWQAVPAPGGKVTGPCPS